MKLTIDKSDLHRGLSHLQAVVEKRNSMPILANVLLRTLGRGKEGQLELAATDLEVGVRDLRTAQVETDGREDQGKNHEQGGDGVDFRLHTTP